MSLDQIWSDLTPNKVIQIKKCNIGIEKAMNCRCFDKSESAVISWKNKNFGPRRITFWVEAENRSGKLGQIWTEGHVESFYNNNLTSKVFTWRKTITEAHCFSDGNSFD
jgi:hypothetical protein